MSDKYTIEEIENAIFDEVGINTSAQHAAAGITARLRQIVNTDGASQVTSNGTTDGLIEELQATIAEQDIAIKGWRESNMRCGDENASMAATIAELESALEGQYGVNHRLHFKNRELQATITELTVALKRIAWDFEQVNCKTLREAELIAEAALKEKTDE